MLATLKHSGSLTGMMLLLLLLWLCPQTAAADDTKPVWQESDATQTDTYLANRRALVGSGCMVNRLGSDGVKVVPVITNLEYLCDEDLSNVTEIGFGADVIAVECPLISVRDIKNHYAAGTTAGFVVTGEASGLLKITAGTLFKIMFYCEGKNVGEAKVSEGQTVNGVGVSLIQISDKEAGKEYVATAPAEFDEIRLSTVGALEIDAASKLGLKYAFVGKAKEYTITKSAIQGYKSGYTAMCGVPVGNNISWYESTRLSDRGNLVDNDTTNNWNVSTGVILEVSTPAFVKAVTTDGSEAFEKGTTIGFKYSTSKILELAGSVMYITLRDQNDNEVQKQNISGEVLGIKLVKAGKSSISITSDTAFSSAEFSVVSVGVGIGATEAYYAYITLPPDVEKHHCDINASADVNVCNCDNSYQLKSSMDGVTWTPKSAPDGSSAEVNATSGLVTSINQPGTYVFTAMASDGCTEDVTIHYGEVEGDFPKSTSTTERLVGDKYAVTDGSNAGISLLSSLKNSKALTSSSLRDYAYYNGGVSLAGKTHIVSVKKKSGTFQYDEDKYVGFVVTAQTNSLKVNLLDFLGINLYKNGEKVDVTLVADNGVLTADLISTDKVQQRICYNVRVPAGTEFDEIALVKAGTLNIDLSQLNIYYAFISDSNGNPENDGGTIVSYKKTGAYIDAANTEFAAVANIGNTAFGLTNLVDDDLNTSFIYPAGVQAASGTKVGVKIGRTINSSKQHLLIVTSEAAAVLTANLIDVMKVELYKNDSLVATNESGGTGFELLSANVLGYKNNHNYIKVSASTDFDEVVLTRGSGLTLDENYEVYGLILRNDYNSDGITDDMDPEPCAQELVLDEEVTLNKTRDYSKARMIFHRNFNGGAWNSLILPVNLTKAQFQEAFGTGALLSEASTVTTSTSDNVTTTTLVFTLVNDETDGVYLAKNKPYIVWLESDEVSSHSADERYESIDDGEVAGPLYFVDKDIDFEYNDVTPEPATNGFTFLGSYDSAQTLKAGVYAFNNGKLVHTNKDRTQRAYRGWIEYSNTGGSEAKTLSGFSVEGQGGTTAIHAVVEEATLNGDGQLYNLSGQRVSPAMLQQGVYILNGKKFIVK